MNRSTRVLEPTLVDARLAINDARALFRSMDTRLSGLDGQTDTLVTEMRALFTHVGATLDSLNRTLANADDARLQATQAFMEFDRAMKAIRMLAEYLQTHPEAVLVGKPKEKE
jgi:paraquat-inducible protein B